MQLIKHIRFFGNPVILACDGRCDKAWGICCRPKKYFFAGSTDPRQLLKGEQPEDYDDYVYLSDSELHTAPEKPGTWEAEGTKPSGTPLGPEDIFKMNRWCARQCERSRLLKLGEPIALPDFETCEPNKSSRR
jgi:hypothetical protein